VKRLDGKPFALIGVNSDENLEEYRKLAKKESVTWRSFQDKLGGDKQAISEMWNVQGWPTLYLIDHKGVIRRKWIGAPDEKALDKAIDELLRAAEKDSPK
jgi:peroxiredoxin